MKHLKKFKTREEALNKDFDTPLIAIIEGLRKVCFASKNKFGESVTIVEKDEDFIQGKFIKGVNEPKVLIGRYLTQNGTFAIGECYNEDTREEGLHLGFSSIKVNETELDMSLYNSTDSEMYGHENIAFLYKNGIIGENIVKYTLLDETKIYNYSFARCTSLTSIEIPNSVTNIGDSAFDMCYSLTSIEIPNSVTSIGDGAFNGCSGLTSVTIPDSVINIDDNAFWMCYSLTSITIGNSVTSIGRHAFEGCDSFTSITIPNSVTNIGDEAFSGCSSLSSVTYNGTTYTSISALESALTNNGVTVGDSVFDYTHLSA